MFFFGHRKAIIDGILGVMNEVSGCLPAENVKDARELLDYNEMGEALSLICTHLYEYNISISRDTYDKIASLARRMKMPTEEWEFLEQLVK